MVSVGIFFLPGHNPNIGANVLEYVPEYPIRDIVGNVIVWIWVV